MGNSRPDGIRNVWRIAGVASLATMVLAASLFIGIRLGSHEKAPPAALPPSPSTGGAPPSAALAADFAQLETKLHAVAGIAISAVGTAQAPITLGDWQSGPAWSTIKVPLIIAALREENPPVVTGAMNSAITES